MSIKFFDSLRRFEEALIGMSGRASLVAREDWMGTPETDRERCADALTALTAAWNQDPQDLSTLQKMTVQCLEFYVKGELDAGDFAVRDIDEFLSSVRDKAAEAKSR